MGQNGGGKSRKAIKTCRARRVSSIHAHERDYEAVCEYLLAFHTTKGSSHRVAGLTCRELTKGTPVSYLLPTLSCKQKTALHFTEARAHTQRRGKTRPCRPTCWRKTENRGQQTTPDQGEGAECAHGAVRITEHDPAESQHDRSIDPNARDNPSPASGIQKQTKAPKQFRKACKQSSVKNISLLRTRGLRPKCG